MDSFIIHYITQRMKSIGFIKFSFEPVLIIIPATKTEYTIDAVNEYYYLSSTVVTEGTQILADNNYFRAASGNLSINFANIREFTGQIKITIPAGTSSALEFIRVIPHS